MLNITKTNFKLSQIMLNISNHICKLVNSLPMEAGKVIHVKKEVSFVDGIETQK